MNCLIDRGELQGLSKGQERDPCYQIPQARDQQVRARSRTDRNRFYVS